MEVWITRQEEKHRRYLPGILLESFLIFLVNGVGTFALLHTLVPSVNGIPFLVSVTVTALLCAVLFRLREHLVAAVFSLSAAAGICLFAFSGMLLNGFLSLWNQLAEVLGKKAGIYLTIYQLKDSGKANGELAASYFPWHCLWAVWLLNPEASVVCAAPSFCGSPSGGSGKNRTASRYQALSWLLRWNPVRIKLHDEK
ncbi:MAG: hypothetical protein ACLRW4_08160 [Ruminococcus sp.]